MAHPYSGAAGYIHANEHLMDDNLPVPSSYYYRQTEWIPVPSPISEKTPISPRRFTSVPNFSTKVKGIRQRTFSISTSATSNPASSIISKPPPLPPVYQSMTIRFDTPDPHIIPWRRQVKGVKRRFQRFRAKMSEFLTPPSWITTPHPRLSMVG